MQSYFQSYYVNTYLKYYFLIGWKETDPVKDVVSNTEVHAVLLFGSLSPPPTDTNDTAVSFLHNPASSEVNSIPEANSV